MLVAETRALMTHKAGLNPKQTAFYLGLVGAGAAIGAVFGTIEAKHIRRYHNALNGELSRLNDHATANETKIDALTKAVNEKATPEIGRQT